MSEVLYERIGRVLRDLAAMPLLSRELAEIRAIIRERDEYKEALEWYAIESNYDDLYENEGAKARQALARHNGTAGKRE